MKQNITTKSINELRVLACQMINQANSGHPGIVLGASPALYALCANHLQVNPKNPTSLLRDRFVLSAGHGSAMLYATLHLFGYEFGLQDLKEFRQLGSCTPGHPELDVARGIEATTGPLGQGLGMAVGMCMAQRHLASKFNKPDIKLIDNYTYVLAGDGDLMEGVSHEVLSLAGAQQLEKLIVLYDSNHITIDGTTKNTFNQNTKQVMQGYGFEVIEVKNANNLAQINKAIIRAKASNKPSFIILHSTIGYASPLAGSNKVHGSPLGEENLQILQQNLKTNMQPFAVSKEVTEHFKQLQTRFDLVEQNWQTKLKTYQTKYAKDYKALQTFLKQDFSGAQKVLQQVKTSKTNISTREAGNLVLQALGAKYDNIFGGAADLVASTKTIVADTKPFTKQTPNGRNVMFGIREFGMSAIANGLALYGGLVPFASTFMVFGDYLKPALRLSAIMQQKVLYILTHDSIYVGEDGPTHQPIEQLTQFRATPNVTVFRPCNLDETKAGYAVALNNNQPTVLALTRQNLPNVASEFEDAMRGGYIFEKEPQKNLDAILIATGSEVHLAVQAQKLLQEMQISARVVSMPSVELFYQQTKAYQNKILPNTCEKRVVIEAGSTLGWQGIAGNKGIVLGMNTFGASGKAQQVAKQFGFTPQQVAKATAKLLK